MKYNEWTKKYVGSYIDYDKMYGVQCVDLIKHYVDKVLGITPKSIGNAIDYYYERYTEPYLTNNFDWYDNTADFVPKKGDIVVFKSQSPAGHIAVCNGIGDTHSFQAYDENYCGTHAPMTLRTWSYKGKRTVLGFHRPKDQSNIIDVTGWQEDNNGWYYINTDGSIATNCWKEDSHGWLYLNENGRIAKNCWQQDKYDWVYLDETGHIATDQWLEDNTGWCYVGENGYITRNQWLEDSITWCYLDSNGHVATNQWIEDSTDWCYLDEEGHLLTNAWKEDNTGWCFLINDGHILRNGYASDSAGKHYLDETGHMIW